MVVVIADYYLPVWVAKKYGATREGIIGSIAGLILGLVFPPVGMVAGLILGAIAGDIIAGKNLGEAVKSGFGSVLGTLFSTGAKLVVSGILSWYMILEVVRHYL